MDVAAELVRLELALARRDEAVIEGGYDAALDEAFEEIGRSGKVWSRSAMLEALATAPRSSEIELEDVRVDELAPDAYLVRYDTVARGARTHRSSIWLRVDGRLRMRFHQGTPASSEP